MVCGVKNEFGLGARFYELDNKELACTFETKECHQSYPGRVHGGIAAAILDETAGRAIDILEPDTWAVTVELNVKYKKPIPVNAKLKAIGRVISNNRKIFEDIFHPKHEPNSGLRAHYACRQNIMKQL